MIDKIITIISSIIITIITSVLSIRFYKIEKKINTISKKLDLESNNEGTIKYFKKTEVFYANQIHNKEYKIAYIEKTNCFINITKDIIKLDDYSIDNWSMIEQNLDNGFYYVKARMTEYLMIDFVEKFYTAHTKEYDLFKDKIKNIFIGIKNNKKQRIIEELHGFLVSYSKSYIAAIKEYEDNENN